MRPLIAHLPQLAGIGLALAGQLPVERKSEFAQAFGENPQKEGEIAWRVEAASSAAEVVFAFEKRRPRHLRRKLCGEDALDER